MSKAEIGFFEDLKRNKMLSPRKAANEIKREFHIAEGDQLISPGNLALLVAELAMERICSRLALASMNEYPEGNSEDIRERILTLYEGRIENLSKISRRTTESNKSRATDVPDYFVLALYVAYVRELEKLGKSPGRTKCENRVSQILGRGPHPREDWSQFLTKHYIEKYLPEFKKITQDSSYPPPELIALTYKLPWLL